MHTAELSHHVCRPHVSLNNMVDQLSNNSDSFVHRLDYTWIDANRKQVKLPAPTYIDYVMSWVQQTIDGRDFPTKRTL